MKIFASRLNKRGNVFKDMLIIPIMLFIVALSIITATYMWNQIQDNTTLFSQDNLGQNRIHHAAQTTINMFPYIFTMIVASMLVGLAITGYFTQSSPVFLIVGIIIIMITVVIAVPFSNAYEDLVTNNIISEASPRIIELIMFRLPTIVVLLGGAFLLTLYSKKSSGGVAI